ncbi:S9 family peptidase [Levilactobacillus namurensis]|uniref:S9 family peptidase n=1 Tax=Levilactobacillus namurensis TaxID=380393 RepID=A0AAW8W3I5_9LACO|nr:S9 family peptidase [Levilactobacillus namurensis]MDT7012846.1 S9 family peptidase [Levilactobacillus namurensis]
MTVVEPEDLFAMRPLAQPVSDGQRAYYLETRLDQSANARQTMIASVRLSDGEDRRRWSPVGVDVHQLTLSPNGQQLAFSGVIHDHAQLFVMATTGGAAVQVTHGDADVHHLLWSADGRNVYFQVDRIPQDNPATPARPAVQVVDRLRYQQNGRGILPQHVIHQAIRYQLATGDQTVVLERATDFTVTAATTQGLLYDAERLPHDEHDFSAGVYWHPFTGGPDHLLTAALTAGSFSQGQLASDGHRVLLWGQDNHVPNVSQYHAWVTDVQQPKLRDLTAPRDVEVGNMLAMDSQQRLSGRYVAWLNDQTVVTLENTHGRLELMAQDLESARVTPLLTGDRAITDFAVVDQHTIVFTESTMTSVSRLKVLDVPSGTERELINPNATYEAQRTLVTGQRFTFKGAQDWPIEGWYFAPVAGKPQHPAVLYVHGGPQVDFGYGFYHELQYLAGRGYGVIAINPRGGNSYGQDFETAVLGHYGDGDFTDLMRGTDAALALDPTIDPHQLCVTGGSYGGFMTNWIETHTDRFAAAVTQRSIANWISFYGTSDIGYYFTPWELKQDMRNIQALWRFSPLAYVKQAHTPILVMHGMEDLRCPTGQGEEFFVGLKEAGVETQLVLFPQSNHELSRSGLPHLRVERLKRIDQWFREHLPATKEDE